MKLPRVTCAVGMFDGIHLGHQKIIGDAVKNAKETNGTSVIITFDKHPYKTLNYSIELPLLTAPAHKLRLLDGLGVDVCVMLAFDKSLAETSADTWIKESLWHNLKVETVYSGETSFFGKGASGSIDTLRQHGAALGFKTKKTDILQIDHIPVSSTVIRNFVTKGDFYSAEKFLGRSYSVYGRHVSGRGRGAQLGFPTINLDTGSQCLPPCGIYAVSASLADISRKQPAAANLGFRPTFEDKTLKPVLELHFLTPPPSNGETTEMIETVFVKKIRDEIKFDSDKNLIDQIKKDIETVRCLGAQK